MAEDGVVRLPRPGSSITDDPLLAVLREGAGRMLTQAIETEVEAFLATHRACGSIPRRDVSGADRPGSATRRAAGVWYATVTGPNARFRPGLARSRCAGRRCATVALPRAVSRSGSPRRSCQPICAGPRTSRNCCHRAFGPIPRRDVSEADRALPEGRVHRPVRGGADGAARTRCTRAFGDHGATPDRSRAGGA
jgi:hypothetical protein